jgi:hypothetical protein
MDKFVNWGSETPEQLEIRRKYEEDVREAAINRFILEARQTANQAATAALAGGGGGETIPSSCIEFVNNTSDGTVCQFWIETSAPTNYTITWGDGETTTGVTTDDVDGGVGDGEGNNKLEVVYDYADSDTEYTARICFDDISLVTYLEFNGDD